MATYSNTLLALSQAAPYGATTLTSSDSVALDLNTITLTPSAALTQTTGAFTYNVSGSNFAVTGSALNFTAGAASAWDMSGGALTLSVKDNAAGVFNLTQGPNSYLSVTTTNGSESVSIGNATTNPSINFLGTGAFSIGGNLSVAGNVTVSGQKMQVDSTVDLFHDNLIVISSGPTGVMDSGLLNERYYTNWGVADVTGTAQAGSGASTIKLASGDAGADDAYVGYSIAITGGTGAGQQRAVLGNVAATKLATVDQPWAVALDETSEYALYASADRFVGIIWNETLGAFRLGVTNADPGQAAVTIETMGLLDVGALNVLTASGSVKFSVSSVGDLAVAVDKFTVAAASGNTAIAGTGAVAGDFAVATNKFTVAAASGNTLIAGTGSVTGDFAVATNKFTVASASGNTLIAGTGSVTGDFAVNTNKFTVAASSGNTAVAGTLGVSGLLSVSASGISASAGSALNLGSATVAPSVATLTSVERDALTPANGMLIYNSTTSQFEGYDSAWGALGAGGSVPGTDNLTFTVNQDNVGADEDAALYLDSGNGTLMRQGRVTMNYSGFAQNGLNFGFDNAPAVNDYGFGFYFTPTNGGAASGATAGGSGGQFFFLGGSGGAAGAGAGAAGVGGVISMTAGTGGMGGAGSQNGASGGGLTLAAGNGGMAAGGTAGYGGTTFLSGGLGGSGSGNGASWTLYGGGGGNQGSATLEAKNIDLGATAVARSVNLATGAAAQTVVIGSTNSTSSLTLDSGTGVIDIGTGAQARTITIGNAAATAVNANAIAMTFTTVDALALTDGSATFQLAGTGATSLSGATTVDLDASGDFQINSSAGAISIGNDAVAQAINIGTGAAARTITIGNAASTASNVNGTAITLTSVDALQLTDGSATFQLGGTGATSLSGATTVDLDASGDFQINSTGGAISIGNDANAQAVNIGTGAAARTVSIGSLNTTSALSLQSGSGNISLNPNGAMVALSGTSAGVNYSYVVGFTANAAEDVTVGDVLYFTASSTVGKVDADAAGKKYVIGIAAETKTSGNATRVASIPGQVVIVNTDTSGMTVGAPVYADATVAGGLVSTAPSASGSVIYLVGYVHTAHATTGKIIYAPQFIAQVP